MTDDPVYGDHVEPPLEQVDLDTETTHAQREQRVLRQQASPPRDRQLKTPRRNR